ncbi:peptidase domain-containing ABC transporter [Pandoraea sp. NPDC090278]|uniref:peptidase domain-containing ABC transporter n=1 Tax=Pandoraea sp. NPDC090278 TaxID=3364391 RepID=UPI00383A6464
MKTFDFLVRKPEMVYQDEISECGLACIAMFIDALGGYVSLSKLRRRAPASTSGISLLQMQEIVEAHGVPVVPVRLEIDQFETVPLPAIFHYGGNHFVLCSQRSGKSVRIFNPATGSAVTPLAFLRESLTGYALILDTTRAIPSFSKKRKPQTAWKPWQNTTLPRSGRLLIAGMIAGLASLVVPTLYSAILDNASPVQRYGNWVPFVVALLVALIATFVSSACSRRLNQGALTIAQARMSELFTQLLRKPISFYEKRAVADILQRFASHGRLVSTRGATLLGIKHESLMSGCTVAVMLAISVRLSLLTLCAIVVYWAINRYFLSRRTPLLLRFEELSGRQSDLVIETLKTIVTVKTAALGANRALRFNESQGNINQVASKLTNYEVQQAAATKIIGYVESIVILMVGAWMLQHEDISFGNLIAFIFFKQIAVDSITNLYHTIIRGREQDVLVRRSRDLICGIDETLVAIDKPKFEKEFEIQNLLFRYDGSEYFMRLNQFKVNVGEKIALIGSSGNGKSTFLKLIGGLYPSQGGELTLDGRSTPVSALRELAYCQLADATVITGTAIDNVLLPESTDYNAKDKILAEKLLAQLDLVSAIKNLPHGPKTELTPANPYLSSGELQRVMVARALCSNRPLILLDEPTANLDEKNAKSTFDAILQSKHAIIVSTHETSQLHRFDKVYRVCNGTVAEISRNIE